MTHPEKQKQVAISRAVKDAPIEDLRTLWSVRFGNERVELDTREYKLNLFWFNTARRLCAVRLLARHIHGCWHIFQLKE